MGLISPLNDQVFSSCQTETLLLLGSSAEGRGSLVVMIFHGNDGTFEQMITRSTLFRADISWPWRIIKNRSTFQATNFPCRGSSSSSDLIDDPSMGTGCSEKGRVKLTSVKSSFHFRDLHFHNIRCLSTRSPVR